jgi:hypothetical protein
MSLALRDSTQFKVNELVIVTKAGNIDISSMYEEINIFDSLFMPVMSGKVLIKDSVGLSGKLIFDGSESLLIDIIKSEDNPEVANFKKAFRIYKQSDRTNDGLNSENYILHFVSDELMYSDQQRINQGYENSYSEIIKKILTDYLKVSLNQLGGVYNDTTGIRQIVIPNLRPLEAIEWCAKRCTDKQNSPNFMFYQNYTGYNFASLSDLLTKPEILDVRFEPKNTKNSNALTEISSARSMEIVSQTDNVDKIRSGVNAATFIGFDPITKMIFKKQISYGDHYNSIKHGNENANISAIENRDKIKNTEAFNSKKIVASFSAARQYSNYIKKYDPTSISKEDNVEEYFSKRKAIIKNLMNRRIKFTMPGNFQLTSGFNVNVIVPNLAKKEKGSDNEDLSVSGKYLIIGTRHIIGYEKHETIIEVATTSTANEFVPASTSAQTQEILDY